MLPALIRHQSTLENPEGSARDPVYAERVRMTSPMANHRPCEPAPVARKSFDEAATPAPTCTRTASRSAERRIVSYVPPSHASWQDVRACGCDVPDTVLVSCTFICAASGSATRPAFQPA